MTIFEDTGVKTCSMLKYNNTNIVPDQISITHQHVFRRNQNRTDYLLIIIII